MITKPNRHPATPSDQAQAAAGAQNDALTPARNPTKPLIPPDVLDKWQRITDLLARVLDVPAALIMRFDVTQIEVFVSSRTEHNPYKPGERTNLDTGLYCEWVREHRCQLYVPNALKDPAWAHNPDIPLGMIAYIGYPLFWPDGEVFGTICALDQQENGNLLAYQDLLNEFRRTVEDDLRFAIVRTELEEANHKLARANAKLQTQNEDLLAASATIEEVVTSLERSNQELDDFAHIVAHDIKEPIRGISQYAIHLLEDYADKLDEDGYKKLATLPRLTDRLTLFIESLLHYSRVGRTDLGILKTDFNELVEEVLDSLQVMLKKNRVDIRIPASLPTLDCDRLRIGEVLGNLIVNAIKYNDKPEKWIEIGCVVPTEDERSSRDLDRETVFYVRDNGIGIREKHLETIFLIFKQLHGHDMHNDGVGAGLTIAKKIVERHGGRIWAESTYGEGTTFYFSLPPTPTTPRLSTSDQAPTKQPA